MTKIRKAPRWAGVFLRALAACGQARRAAELAGVDHTTAYNRRKAHADFADAWADALAAFVADQGTGPSTISSAENGSCGARDAPGIAARLGPHAPHREEFLVLQPGADGARAARGGAGRWNAAAEKRFFTALADRANVRDAAAAAGFSTNAVYARRTKRPEFRRAWEAAVETGKARLQMLLMDAAEKAFDPKLLDVSEEAPKVSVAEALNILKAREGKQKELGAKRDSWGDESEAMSQEDEDELRARFLAKLDRLVAQDEARKIAKGWTRHGETLVPPGWVPGADWVEPPEEPPNLCRADRGRLGLTDKRPSA